MLISGFTFDPVSKTCKSFKDRGCAETKNLYRTLEECETTCSKFFILCTRQKSSVNYTLYIIIYVNNQTLYLIDSKPKQEGDKCASDSECGEGLECKNENHFHPFGINFKFPNLTCVKKEGNDIIISKSIGKTLLSISFFGFLSIFYKIALRMCTPETRWQMSVNRSKCNVL